MELADAVTEVNGINDQCELVLRVRRLGTKKWPKDLLYLESTESFLPAKVRIPLASAMEEDRTITVFIPLGISLNQLIKIPNPLIKLKVLGRDSARDVLYQSNAILIAVGAVSPGPTPRTPFS
jgi:hypothetical protein